MDINLLRSLEWKLFLFFHYWFGKEEFNLQLGDHIDVLDCFDEVFKKEVKNCFSQQISLVGRQLKGSVHNPVTVYFKDPNPRGELPLRGYAVWKAIFTVCTRKSWKTWGEVPESQIVFKEEIL